MNATTALTRPTRILARPSTAIAPSPEIADLFDLDPRTAPIAKLPTIGKSSNCTNDGCTASCNSCTCK